MTPNNSNKIFCILIYLKIYYVNNSIVFKISNETNLIFHFTAYNAKNNILSLKILFDGYNN